MYAVCFTGWVLGDWLCVALWCFIFAHNINMNGNNRLPNQP